MSTGTQSLIERLRMLLTFADPSDRARNTITEAAAELAALTQKLESMRLDRDAWVDDALLRAREITALRTLLVEWRETELDSMDEEYEPWIESFTARVDAVLGADHSAGAGKPIKEEG